MEDIKQMADCYRNLKVWVSPIEGTENDFYKVWKNIRTEQAYCEKAESFQWDKSQGINLITGKKGAMVLYFPKDNDKSYTEDSLKKVLTILMLPKDYRWVIDTNFTYAIVLDVYNLPSGRINMKYRDLHIVWEDNYILPPGTELYPRHFKYGIPYSHPFQISWDILLKRIEEIDNHHLIIDDVVLQERARNEIKGKMILGILIAVFVGIATIPVVIASDIDFATWITMYLVILGVTFGIVYMMSS